MISFSFYLIHQPALLMMQPLVERFHIGSSAELLLGMTVGVGVIALFAWLFFCLVERPFLVRGGMREAIVPDADRMEVRQDEEAGGDRTNR